MGLIRLANGPFYCVRPYLNNLILNYLKYLVFLKENKFHAPLTCNILWYSWKWRQCVLLDYARRNYKKDSLDFTWSWSYHSQQKNQVQIHCILIQNPSSFLPENVCLIKYCSIKTIFIKFLWLLVKSTK